MYMYVTRTWLNVHRTSYTVAVSIGRTPANGIHYRPVLAHDAFQLQRHDGRLEGDIADSNCEWLSPPVLPLHFFLADIVADIAVRGLQTVNATG